jgi:hypothetical protein
MLFAAVQESAIGTKRTLHRDRAMSLLEVKQTYAGRLRQPDHDAIGNDPTISYARARGRPRTGRGSGVTWVRAAPWPLPSFAGLTIETLCRTERIARQIFAV